jgi:hypothetical protein
MTNAEKLETARLTFAYTKIYTYLQTQLGVLLKPLGNKIKIKFLTALLRPAASFF